jgi:hypothetical protein
MADAIVFFLVFRLIQWAADAAQAEATNSPRQASELN